jgi:hypothetical protein
MTLAKKETPPRINRIPNPRISQSGKPTNRRTKKRAFEISSKSLVFPWPKEEIKAHPD